jgi:hypothetical protein
MSTASLVLDALFSPDPAAARRAVADRVDTAALCSRSDVPARALVVFNPAPTPTRNGVAVFRAAFPVRESVGARPVTVRNDRGFRAATRRENETLEPMPGAPGRLLWSFDLVFAVHEVPALGWRSFAARYEDDTPPPDFGTLDVVAPASRLSSAETECHGGDLPAIFTLAAAVDTNGKAAGLTLAAAAHTGDNSARLVVTNAGSNPLGGAIALGLAAEHAVSPAGDAVSLRRDGRVVTVGALQPGSLSWLLVRFRG